MLNFVHIADGNLVFFSHSKFAYMKSPFGCVEKKLK